MYVYDPVEAEWIEGCRTGDSKSQERVYRHYSARMYAVCCRYLRNQQEAEDVLISAFTRVFSGIRQYRGDGSFEGWIRRIVVNEALMALRKRKSRFDEVELQVLDRTQGSDQWQLHPVETNGEHLVQLVRELPDGYRTVFNLYAVEGYSHQEISALLGIDVNTSKSQLSRARQWLRRKLEDPARNLKQKSSGNENEE